MRDPHPHGTKVVANGQPGQSNVKWGVLERILTGVAITLLCGITFGIFKLYTQVQIMDYRLARVERSVEATEHATSFLPDVARVPPK